LQKYCVDHFNTLLNTRFSDIITFITNPAFENNDISPIYEGWNKTFQSDNVEYNISYPEMNKYLHDSINIKNLFIDFEKLKEKLGDIDLQSHYKSLYEFYTITFEQYMQLSNTMISKIMKYMIYDDLQKIENYFTKSNDNIMSYIKYNPEKYPGFLIKIKTPNVINAIKTTTIKIFPKGKINIDGANSRHEAEFIYYWLNNVFYNNPSLIYFDNYLYTDYDSEFSSDSEEDE